MSVPMETMAVYGRDEDEAPRPRPAAPVPRRGIDHGEAVEARRQRRRLTEGLRTRLTWGGLLLVTAVLVLSVVESL